MIKHVQLAAMALLAAIGVGMATPKPASAARVVVHVGRRHHRRHYYRHVYYRPVYRHVYYRRVYRPWHRHHHHSRYSIHVRF